MLSRVRISPQLVSLALSLVALGLPFSAHAQSPEAISTMAPMPGMTNPPTPRSTKGPLPALSPSPKPNVTMSSIPLTSPTMAPMQMGGATPGAGATDVSSPTSIGESMSQEGSGTGWVPKSTQMFGWMRIGARDMQMRHGAIFPRYVASGSLRGDRRADAPNWLMFMGTHAISASSQFGYTAMVSADPLTENQSGYPLLFQTGETAHGVALHDHQHPHDLFSELALSYSARLGKAATGYVYLGYPGEPALGPTAFMHRRIAYDMPESTIGHHWQDASHIQFGVATLGFSPSARVKIEASAFTGREPNEIRTNFDPIHVDSASSRLSWNPNDNSSAEVSYGFIKSPEVLNPQINQHRLVASLLLNKPLGLARNWYTGFVFGQNIESGGARSSSYLAESDYQAGRTTVYARLESGTRSARDLVIAGVDPESVYHVGSYGLGAVYDLTRTPSAANIGLGAQITLGSKSASLNTVYGTGTPVGFQVFFRVRPPDMARSMSGMSMGGR